MPDHRCLTTADKTMAEKHSHNAAPSPRVGFPPGSGGVGSERYAASLVIPPCQGHSILITWNSAIIENTQDNISKSSVFIDADVLGCINMRHQTTFNALYSAPDEPCGCRNSHMHINEIFVSNDPGSEPHRAVQHSR